MRDCAAAESHALEENSYRRIHISQHWFLGATFHNGSYVHSGRKKRQWWKRWKTAARVRISTRFMTIELLSWPEVLGHLTFHLIVATISSGISTKNRDCSPQAETTWPVCQVGLGRVLLTANETSTSPIDTFPSLRRLGADHVAVLLHRHLLWLGREDVHIQYPYQILSSCFSLCPYSGRVTVVGPGGWIVFKLRLNSYALTSFQNGRSPLYDASWNGHVEVVTKLIAANAGINLKDQVRTNLRV